MVHVGSRLMGKLEGQSSNHSAGARGAWVFRSISLLAVLAATSTVSAFAQTASPTDAAAAAGTGGQEIGAAEGQVTDSQETGIADIVVTAEKRTSVVQRTALSVSVLDSADLTKNAVSNVSDLASIAPSLSIARNNNGTVIVIRGVSSRDVTQVGDPAVSLTIDGFNLQRASGLDSVMFDLERVEVLRGPQGTLLGRNATGGAVNIITAKPLDRFAAYIGGEFGNFSTIGFNGMLNIPVSDTLSLRASFQTKDHNGYRNNAPAENADDQHSRAARLHVLFKPTPRLRLLLTGEYAEDNSNGPAINGIPIRFYTSANVPNGFIPGDIDFSRPDRSNANDRFAMPPGGYLRYKIWNIRAQADYDLGFATLTYQGGYRHMDYARRGILGGAGRQQNYSFVQTEDLPSWNHELRLASNGDTPFRWQIGGFYFQEKNRFYNEFVDYPGAESISGTPTRLQLFSDPDIIARARAVFGQASYEFLPGLRIEAGARYSEDRKYRTSTTISTNIATYLATRCDLTNSCVYTTQVVPQLAESSKTTYHAAINYQATPSNLLYAKFDTGYKAGGFSTVEYFPETVRAFEIGSKNRFFNNTLQVNLSAYLYQYSNQQVNQTQVDPSNGGVRNLILNAGQSRYKGVEADIQWQPTPDDRLSLYVAYNQGRYVDFATSASGQLLRLAQIEGAAVPVTASTFNYQLAGKRPPQAPDWSLNAGYEHDFHVFGGTLTPRIQTHYESASFFSFYNLALDKQDAYFKTDFLLSFTPENRAWLLSGYIRNIENKLILANVQSPPSTTFNSYREQYQMPRSYGLIMKYTW